MEKPRRTWMPASWKFLPKPQRLPVNRKRLNVLVKAKIWHKANDKLVGRCEGRWMDVEEMSPIWCELHGVKKSQASFFFLKSEAFSLLMEAGAHLSLKDPLTVENRGTHCLWEHHFRLTSLTSFRWFQSLRWFPFEERMGLIFWMELQGLNTPVTCCFFFEDFGESQRWYQGSQGLKELDKNQQLQVQVWPKTQPWNLGFAR